MTCSSNTVCSRSQPTTARGSSARIHPMNRIGHDSSPNSATNPVSSPRVTAPLETRARPHGQQQRGGEGRQGVERGLERGAHVPARHAVVAQGGRLLPEPRGLGRLPAEGLHDQGAVDRLVRDGGDLADRLLGAAGGSLHPTREAPVHQRERREHHEADQREPDVGPEQREQSEHHQRRARRSRTAPARRRRRPPSRRPPCGRAARRWASPGGTGARDPGTGPRSGSGASPSRARPRRRCSTGGS